MGKKEISPHKATLKEIAAEAGVSIATVSYVLNNKQKSIPEGTRNRVLETVERLGYTPNKSARAIRTSRTGGIGLIVPDITNSYFSAFVQSVTTAAADHHCNVYLLSSNGVKSNEKSASNPWLKAVLTASSGFRITTKILTGRENFRS